MHILFYVELNDNNNMKSITTPLANPCFIGKRMKDVKLLIIVKTFDNKKYEQENI